MTTTEWRSAASDRYSNAHHKVWDWTVDRFCRVLLSTPALTDPDGRQALKYLLRRLAHIADISTGDRGVIHLSSTPKLSEDAQFSFIDDLCEALYGSGAVMDREQRERLAGTCMDFAELLADEKLPDELWERAARPLGDDVPPERFRPLFRAAGHFARGTWAAVAPQPFRSTSSGPASGA